MAHRQVGEVLVQAALSVLPVLLFLLALALIDTYRLLTLSRILRIVAIGCGVAASCWLFNTWVYGLGVNPQLWPRIGAPIFEEAAKALFAAWLIRNNRVAFMVDSAICGFALGAGFSVVENLSYLPVLSGAAIVAAAVRGLGTAMMHGGATALFAVVSNSLAEMRGSAAAVIFLPGLVLAAGIHIVYNQHLFAPVYSAVLMLVAIPVLLACIFERSEKALEKWLGSRLDKDIDLLQMIDTGGFVYSDAGRYLQTLKSTFPSEIVGDMLCYLQVSLELSARAKGDLLRREMGFPVERDRELPSRLREMDWLEQRIGIAGKLALAPLLGQGRRDVWELRKMAGGGR
jgi:protease PrsW